MVSAATKAALNAGSHLPSSHVAANPVLTPNPVLILHPVLTPGDRAPVEPAGLTIDPEQLHAELADLHAELEVAVRNKNVTEEEYLDQIIMVRLCLCAHVRACVHARVYTWPVAPEELEV